ncbi:MAG: hypothetical protein GXP43_02660, partial [bacterium]|nr:hypothetical protein [bacterium]
MKRFLIVLAIGFMYAANVSNALASGKVYSVDKLIGKAIKVSSKSAILISSTNSQLALKPDSSFSIELWVKPQPTKAGVLNLVARTARSRDYAWSRQSYRLFLFTGTDDRDQKAQIRLSLGKVEFITPN